ncbi:MAG: TIGR00159 family protein [Planctomycetaceae bacterium]|nr:TIGR00159 family protein [Planctomycetaceae bacterium]
MLSWLLSGSTIALIVLFAPEMRRGLSLLAQSRMLSPFLRSQSSGIIDELANAAVKLSKNRIGALVAIERDIGLGEYIEHGVRIDAALTSELLESLFYPGSALHDGAVIVQHDRVAAAGCLLPLTDDTSLSKSMGTRHRAAIGISEETDAIALVVSEETGRISVSVRGKLAGDLTRESLVKTLSELYSRGDRSPMSTRKKAADAGSGSSGRPPDLPTDTPKRGIPTSGAPKPGNGQNLPHPALAESEADADPADAPPPAREKKGDSKKLPKKPAEPAGGEEATA